jgi:farnesyl-diphosphate farnesyltransferase
MLTDRKFYRKPKYPRDPSKESPDKRRCYELLNLTSRSFATVIQELHPELRDAVSTPLDKQTADKGT